MNIHRKLSFANAVPALAAALLLPLVAPAPASAAQHRDAACDGSRAAAKALAAGGTMSEPFPAVASVWDHSDVPHDALAPLDRDDAARVTLRYSAQHRCVWGLMTLDRKWAVDITQEVDGPEVWLDVSTDEGRTVGLGQVNPRLVQRGNSSTYTATWDTAPINAAPYSVRACGYGVHELYSLSGRAAFKAKHVGPGLSSEIRPDTVACTPWLTARP